MTLDRQWCMPSGNTFSIKPIRELIEKWKWGKSIDPFANTNKLADVTNDLNPEYDTDYHLDALEFLKQFENGSIDTVLFDPPYSPTQVKTCYEELEQTVDFLSTTSAYWSNLKKEISRITHPDSVVITCSWNSGGIGQKFGFDIQHILMVAHGGWHNDTIVVVDKKRTNVDERTLKLAKIQQTYQVEYNGGTYLYLGNSFEEIRSKVRYSEPVKISKFENNIITETRIM